MTVYYVTLGVVAYFLVMAELTNRRVSQGLAEPTSRSNPSRTFLLLAAAALSFVAGLRWKVGTDYGGYARNYEPYQDSFVTDLMTFNEPGAKGLAFLASLIHDDFATFIFLASLITVGLMLRTIAKYSPAVGFSVLLFVFAGLWHGSFNGLRQYLAAAVILAGHRFAVSRQLFRYALVVLIAGSFHISALAMIGLYFVPRRRLNVLGVSLMLAVGLVALNYSDIVLGLVESVKGEELNTDYVMSAINPLRIAVAVAPAALYGLSAHDSEAEAEWFYRNMAVVHAGIMVAASWSAYLGRFGIYSAVFIPLVLPRLVNFSNPVATFWVRLGVVVLFAVYWYSDVAPSAALNDFKWIFDREPL